MESVVNQLARDLSEAIAAAVADDARVAACRERARAEGYDLQVTLEAVIGFVDRAAAPDRTLPARVPSTSQPFEMNASDRRFLKSLRIAADEPTEKI